jgi:hypothetical protein
LKVNHGIQIPDYSFAKTPNDLVTISIRGEKIEKIQLSSGSNEEIDFALCIICKSDWREIVSSGPDDFHKRSLGEVLRLSQHLVSCALKTVFSA